MEEVVRTTTANVKGMNVGGTLIPQIVGWAERRRGGSGGSVPSPRSSIRKKVQKAVSYRRHLELHSFRQAAAEMGYFKEGGRWIERSGASNGGGSRR